MGRSADDNSTKPEGAAPTNPTSSPAPQAPAPSGGEAAAAAAGGAAAVSAQVSQPEPPPPEKVAEATKPQVESTGPATLLQAHDDASTIPADHVGLRVQTGNNKLEVKSYSWDPKDESKVAAANEHLAELKEAKHILYQMQTPTFGGTGNVATAVEHKAGNRYICSKLTVGG
jgi:hypothetical protein